ncbi:hypothetical protein MBLNU230_g5732t1 [Neophaeotheca triangularis]
MICQRCLRATLRSQTALPRPSFRSLTTTSPLHQATPVTAETTETTNPRPESRGPAATATPGVTQPFSTPLEPAPSNLKLPIAAKQTKAPARIASSCAAGTVLKGLNFTKGAQDPVAKKDDEYPAWLWRVLAPAKKEAGAEDKGVEEGDLFSKSKKQRRLAAKALRKLEAQNPGALVPKVPVFEQSVDLFAGDGSLEGRKQAGEVRGDLTKAMRGERRRRIKEANFLKAMG